MKTTLFLGAVLALTSWMAEARVPRECGGKPADVIFVLDASSSIWGPDFQKQLGFVYEVVEQFDIRPSRARCGLVTYSDLVRVEFNLDTYSKKDDMQLGIIRAPHLTGGTRTERALVRVRKMFEERGRQGVPHVAVVMTDGKSDEPELTKAEARLAREAGVVLLAVGIGSRTDRRELESLASSRDLVFEVDTFDALQGIRDLLAVKTCEIEEGYQGDQPSDVPTKGCDGQPAEVVFALDSSSSIWEPDFQRQLQFVQDLVGIFEVSPTATRVGLLTYSTKPKRQFDLDAYESEADVIRAIGKVRQRSGNTNTADAIRMMRHRMFDRRVVRDDVMKIGIIITDGKSDKRRSTAKQASLARDAGIRLFAIGVGEAVDPKELYNIASTPKQDFVFEVNTYEALASIKDLLAMKACIVTVPPTPPTTPTTPMPTTTTTVATTATPTTTTTPPPTACGVQRPVDIVFAVPDDASRKSTNQILRFVRDVTGQLDLESQEVRFGVMPKGCFTVPELALQDGGESQSAVLNKLRSEERFYKQPAQIIRELCDRSFSVTGPVRPEMRRVGVVFVDERTASDAHALTEAMREADRAKNQLGIELIVVGVGPNVSPLQLQGLTEESRTFLVDSPHDLFAISQEVAGSIDQICAE